MEHLIVDGYNLICSWSGLKELARHNLGEARQKLTEILIEYQAFTGQKIILVFDAYRSKAGGRVEVVPGVEIHYSAYGQTADSLIEALVTRLSGRYPLSVVTSDWAQQQIVLGKGARRWSSPEFGREVERVIGQISITAQRTKLDRPTTALETRISPRQRKILDQLFGRGKNP